MKRIISAFKNSSLVKNTSAIPLTSNVADNEAWVKDMSHATIPSPPILKNNRRDLPLKDREKDNQGFDIDIVLPLSSQTPNGTAHQSESDNPSYDRSDIPISKNNSNNFPKGIIKNGENSFSTFPPNLGYDTASPIPSPIHNSNYTKNPPQANGSAKGRPTPQEETTRRVAYQIALPYLVAGLGMVAAGVVLDHVQHWPVFEAITELFILMPALLGLKGNVEMTLASRISTQANLGRVDSARQYLSMTQGNLSLLQVQSISLGLFAALLALVIGFIPDGGTINLHHAQILVAACLITTSLASAMLGIMMIAVVYITRMYNLNPDNIATPMAASLGDLVALGILAVTSRFLFKHMATYPWICMPIILIYVLSIPLWYCVCKKNVFVKAVLTTGWIPIIISMSISTFGGLILDYTVKHFNGIAVYQPVINGVGGNLVAIQASRLSTDFHKLGPPGTLNPPPLQLYNSKPLGQVITSNNGSAITAANTTTDDDTNKESRALNYSVPATFNFYKTFFSSNFNSKMARLLLYFALPGHVFFMFLISYIKHGRITITPFFALFYLTSAMLQVIILLYLANVLTLSMWKRKTDPDNASIPYLTAIGDFLGISLLSLSFFLLFHINKKDPNLEYG
ncbi:solute carrier family 41 member 1-like isoform X1 [Gordionus sp. m RMFG-2023]|uniref:solute carrier family 41 member 1-like isoform X1 n=1 Tax=Gordionus sp. m RMFG-2023 TaxID=3053472 RepID=UPI0031FCE988